MAKTAAFHAVNLGSIPGAPTKAWLFHNSKSTVWNCQDYVFYLFWFLENHKRNEMKLCWICHFLFSLQIDCRDGRVVKAFECYSNGIFPRRFESYFRRQSSISPVCRGWFPIISQRWWILFPIAFFLMLSAANYWRKFLRPFIFVD